MELKIKQTMPASASSAILVAFALPLLFCLQSWINQRQPQPYMDELFHVPQAQEICTKAIQRKLPVYHPSITTLPGVYLPNAILATVLGSILVCSTSWLRATSALAALLCLPLLLEIIKSLRNRSVSVLSNSSVSSSACHSDVRDHSLQITLIALITWLHPVFLFYANLYYTDTSAMFWLLMTWYLSLKGRTFSSALCGLLATATRQTNMVWHAFIIADTLIYNTLRRKTRQQRLFIYFITVLPRIAMENIAHGLAFVLYIAFLIWNGGVAVGDKVNHEVTLHYAMLPYFLGFHTASFLLLQFLVPGRVTHDMASLCRRETAIFFVNSCFILAALVTATADGVHPFILADNRHFTFYVYRKWILRSSLHRLVLVPVYAWSLLSCHNDFSFRSRRSSDRRQTESQNRSMDLTQYPERVLDVLLFVCVCITLIPSSLLEPRYFTAANMILTVRRISRTIHQARLTHMTLISAVCVVANVVVAFIFAEMPFERPLDVHMPMDKSPGRFMF